LIERDLVIAAFIDPGARGEGLRYYAAPALLGIDQVGYLSYSNRHAELLFDLSAAATNTKAPSSPPTGPSPNGARSSLMPPASSPWSIG
jgi:hypothetical protein